MTVDEVAECSAVLHAMMKAMRGTLASASGQSAADLFYAIGDLLSNAADLLQASALGAPLANVFALAVTAGAAIPDMEGVRLAMTAQRPVTLPAVLLVNAGLQLAVLAEVQILAATTFASTQDVDAALSAINDAFDPAEEFAADNHDPDVFQALVAAHAACVQDLTTRARPLPKLIGYATVRPLTSHALAYRLYGDAGRADQLRAENGVVHPAFCPTAGTALSE